MERLGNRHPSVFKVGALTDLVNRHVAVFKVGALPVPFCLRGHNLLDSQVAGFGYDEIYGFSVEFGKHVMLAQFLDLQLVVKDKVNIPAICNLLCHFLSLLFFRLSSSRRSRCLG